jgi:multisubunit Na+/H+ antiporter MnhF subunit
MSAWHLGTILFLASLLPCAWIALRGRAFRRLVGLELTGTVLTLLLLAWSQAERRSSLVDLGLTMAFLSFGAGLVFARFLERAP